jgi:uncharacterized OsmC-like protein
VARAIALMLLALAALAALPALGWAIVFVPYTLSRSISRRWHLSVGATPQTAPALLPAGRQNESDWKGAPSHLLGTGTSSQSPGATTLRSVQRTDARETDAAPTGRALHIMPTRRGDGFKATIHGHTFELADPTDGRLAPSPDDLLIASIASDVAWSARRLLRANGLPDDLSVSATWRTTEGHSSLAEINLTVAVSSRAESMRTALSTAFEQSLVARSRADPLLHISYEGANR